ncbi:MAG TPA: rod shape-determining protein MreC [Rhizomicrobium sp.]|jgi:rod shape-determining protein MreC|nr:rod shape-determining protein MreC [Rhizomicrobium sp.]
MANGTWKIARGKASAQLSLAIVVILAIGLVVLGKAQSSLFDRARVYYSDAIAPALKTVGRPFDGVSNWFGGMDHFFDVYSENTRLKAENAKLRQWQSAALVLDARVKRYQLLLNAVPDPALEAISARVIGRDNRPFLDTLILDAGKGRGVKPGEAVIDTRGMIGRVFLAGDHTAWVILLTDLNSRVPVVIEPGNIQAMMAGDNSEAPSLQPMSQGAQLKEGAQVVTSGDGGLLPNGVPVGTVVWDGSAYRVALLADASTADDVRIVDLKQPPEQAPSVTPGDLPAVAAGLPPLVTKPPVTALPPTTLPGATTPATQTAATPASPQAITAHKPPAAPAQPATDPAADDPGDQ